MTKELKDLKKAGYQVDELTPYQFRIDMVLDLYPKRRRFHNIRTQERGTYPENLKEFVAKQVAAAPKPKAEQELKPHRHLTPEMERKAGWWTRIQAK